MVSFKIAAIQILRKEKKALHYEEITEKAIKENLIETTGSTPEATMNALIAVDIKNKKDKSPFIRVKPGFFKLNDNFSLSEEKTEIKEEETREIEEQKEKISTQFTGSAGEHMVLGELLFRGFNSSIMTVDNGMDIIATKNNSMFNVQVKTSKLNKTNVYNFDISVNSFNRYKKNNSFYIFVLRGDLTEYIILPYSEVKKNIIEKNILNILKNTRYRVVIKKRNNKFFLGNKSNNISYYLNNWSVLE